MFSQKLLTASFNLASGNFGGGGNALTLSNMRMSCDLHVVTGDGQSYLDNLTIYGMTLNHMNQLTQVGNTYNNLQKNTLTIQAGSAEEGMSNVWTGTIVSAVPDGTDQPNIRFLVTASAGAFGARQPAKPTTRKGAAAGEDLVAALASKLGYRFENNGVHMLLQNPYLHGTAISQIRQVARAMNCQWLIDKETTLAIWPTGKSREGSATVVSKDTGMVGYPQFNQGWIRVTSYYNPSIIPGGQIQVQSEFTAANGVWNLGQIDYELDSLMPHGRWFMTMNGYNQKSTGLPGGDQP